jgi:hypothetical protein
LHQRRSSLRVSDHDHGLVTQLEADTARSFGVVDPREDRDRSPIERGQQTLDRLGHGPRYVFGDQIGHAFRPQYALSRLEDAVTRRL